MDDNRDKIEEIKEKLDIVNVIQRYVKLKSAGRNFVGLCPFHSEKTPSFSVNAQLQIFKCFGCGKGGDIFTFIQDVEKIDFVETLEKLAKEAGVTIEKGKTDGKFKKLEQLNEIARRYFSFELLQKKNKEAFEYVTNRGISKESIEKFSIGYAPKNSSLLAHIRKLKIYSNDDLLQSGLFTLKNRVLRDKFRDRIMFPILSSRGKVIAFSGRIMPGNEYGPKYINSADSPIFHKGLGVYGIYESRQAIRKEDLCIVCEGSTDVISAHAIGLENIVAPLGTALTEEQVSLISRLSPNLLFLFDSDSAGQKALERAFIISSKLGINAYATNTDPHKDLDELIQKDPKKALALPSKREDLFSYLVSQFTKNKDLTEFKDFNLFKKYIESLLKDINDSSLRNFYLAKVEKITGIPFDGKNDLEVTSTQNIDPKNSQRRRLTIYHHYLLSILNLDTLKVPDNHILEYISDEKVLNILSEIKENRFKNVKELTAALDEQRKSYISNLLLYQNQLSSYDLEQLYKNIVKIGIEKRLRSLRVQLGSAESGRDKEKINSILKEIQEQTVKLRGYK